MISNGISLLFFYIYKQWLYNTTFSYTLSHDNDTTSTPLQYYIYVDRTHNFLVKRIKMMQIRTKALDDLQWYFLSILLVIYLKRERMTLINSILWDFPYYIEIYFTIFTYRTCYINFLYDSDSTSYRNGYKNLIGTYLRIFFFFSFLT